MSKEEEARPEDNLVPVTAQVSRECKKRLKYGAADMDTTISQFTAEMIGRGLASYEAEKEQ